MNVNVFWILYTICAIWLQSFQPGLDIFAPALVVSLQEESAGRTFRMGAVWVLLQEGMGSMAFGSVILLYASIVGMYIMGRWLFESKNFFFICLLGIGTAAIHAGLILTMAILEDAVVNSPDIVGRAFMQALIFPPLWLVVSGLYARYIHKYASSLRL